MRGQRGVGGVSERVYGSSMNRWGFLIVVPAVLVVAVLALYWQTVGSLNEPGARAIVLVLVFFFFWTALIAFTSGRLAGWITITVALIVVVLIGILDWYLWIGSNEGIA